MFGEIFIFLILFAIQSFCHTEPVRHAEHHGSFIDENGILLGSYSTLSNKNLPNALINLDYRSKNTHEQPIYTHGSVIHTYAGSNITHPYVFILSIDHFGDSKYFNSWSYMWFNFLMSHTTKNGQKNAFFDDSIAVLPHANCSDFVRSDLHNIAFYKCDWEHHSVRERKLISKRVAAINPLKFDFNFDFNQFAKCKNIKCTESKVGNFEFDDFSDSDHDNINNVKKIGKDAIYYYLGDITGMIQARRILEYYVPVFYGRGEKLVNRYMYPNNYDLFDISRRYSIGGYHLDTHDTVFEYLSKQVQDAYQRREWSSKGKQSIKIEGEVKLISYVESKEGEFIVAKLYHQNLQADGMRGSPVFSKKSDKVIGMIGGFENDMIFYGQGMNYIIPLTNNPFFVENYHKIINMSNKTQKKKTKKKKKKKKKKIKKAHKKIEL